MKRWLVDAVLLIVGFSLWRAASWLRQMNESLLMGSSAAEASQRTSWTLLLYVGSVLVLLAFVCLTLSNLWKIFGPDDSSSQGG